MDEGLATRKLFMRAAAIEEAPYDTQYLQRLIERIDHVNFVGDLTHDWRDHIDESLRQMWPYMSHLHRMIAFITAIKKINHE